MELKGKLVFMSAGISDPKQSHTGGLSKDFWGVRGLIGSSLFYEESCLWSTRTFNALINHF